MNTEIHAMGEAPVPGLLWRFAAPAMAGLIANALYHIVDRIFLGHLVGPAGLSGVTVAFPFFILQPCLGFGIAGSKTPSPVTTRMKSLAAHAAFGVGLYVCALALVKLFPGWLVS